MRYWPLTAAGLGLLALTMCARIDSGAAVQPTQSAAEAIACARSALGGQALGSLVSLTVVFDVVPASTNTTGQPMTSELALTFPDRFTKTDRVRLVGREMVFTRGIDGQKVLGEPDSASLRALQGEFARWVLVLLLRETSAVPLRWSPELGSDGTRVTVAAAGPNGFNMTLALDRSTCRPTSATYDRPPNLGDEPAARTATTGRFIERYDLAEYRMFDGIHLPTRIQMVTNGTPLFEWTITSARVGASPQDRD